MATKKKTETKELYIDGKRATLKMVYELLKKDMADGAVDQVMFNTHVAREIEELKKLTKENRSYSINVIVPETKPWYKRLFGK